MLKALSKTTVRKRADITIQAEAAFSKSGKLICINHITCHKPRQHNIKYRALIVHGTAGQPTYRHQPVTCIIVRQQNMAPGSTGEPYDTIRASVFLMASGVLSSGSTLIPPVQNTISAPASIARKHPSVIFCHHHQTPHETSSVRQTLLFFFYNRCKCILYPAMVHFVSGCNYCCFSDHKRLNIKDWTILTYIRSFL